MIVSADFPDELSAKLDTLINEPQLPTWPFARRTLNTSTLSDEERQKLYDYHAAFAAYERLKDDPNRLRSRSAVLRMIVTEYFASKNGHSSSLEK